MVHLRTENLQCRLVLAEARGQHQGFSGPKGHAAGEDQLRRAVAAENLLFFHPFKFRNGGNKLPAIGVRVVAQSVDAARHRVFHGLGGTVGIDIGGKIQQDLPGVQIPAVGILGFIQHGFSSNRLIFLLGGEEGFRELTIDN